MDEAKSDGGKYSGLIDEVHAELAISTAPSAAERGVNGPAVSPEPSFLCSKCNKRIRVTETEEHMDFHYAQEVQGQLIRAAAGGLNPTERLAARDEDRSKRQRTKRQNGPLFAAFARQKRRR